MCPLNWEHGVLDTGPPGKPHPWVLNEVGFCLVCRLSGSLFRSLCSIHSGVEAVSHNNCVLLSLLQEYPRELLQHGHG